MLSHVRIKADKNVQNSTEPEELQKLYAAIDRPDDDAADAPDHGGPPCRNPFLSFQSESEEEMDEPDEEAPQCVYKQLQIGEAVIMAVMLMSNGAKVPAARYSEGDNGCIVAHWGGG